ncbi:MAG: site-specific DNA-methyltransferase [Chloroflexi bacterium]|nr:site-specific DNA-methyltransferase [Chloroflexota bacterium]MCL5274209.1 site-specific DNA-methyltransferase [Chloroflexota bacterium]
MADKIRRLQLPAPQGRSLLTWEDKRPLRRVTVSQATLVETFRTVPSLRSAAHDPAPGFPCAAAPDSPALLFHGDNKAVMACLLANGWQGRVKLIYIDPPFDTGNDFSRKVTLRGCGTRRSLRDDALALGRQSQYADSWTADTYLQFIYERLPLMRQLLADDGSIWLHCDYRRAHYLRLLLEEVFGPENYLNTISWRSQTTRGAKVNAFYFPYSTQYIEIFAKNRSAPTTWNPARKWITMSEAAAAAEYMHDDGGYFRTSDPGSYSFDSLRKLHAHGRLYAPFGGDVVVDETLRRVYASNGGNIGVKYYLKSLGRGKYAVERGIDNLWDDIPGLGTTPSEDLGYPTQKTEALLRRIIAVATNPNDIVLDCFAGSGTTAAVAQKTGRRWIACDVNPVAVQTIAKRLHWALVEQAEKQCESQPELRMYRVGTPDKAGDADTKGTADVAFERVVSQGRQKVKVVVTGYQSPALTARLQASVKGAHRPPHDFADWRMAVDSVMIDPDYDGRVLNIALSDAPRRKRDLVSGVYELPISQRTVTVAVKITDILGAETLVTRSL